MTIRMHEWPRNQALHASEQIISARIFLGAMAWRLLKPIKLITLQKYKVY